MENHYFDAEGVYTASAPANAGTLPPDNALRVAPPAQAGFWPVANAAGDGWDLVPDHRGKEGWLDGVPSAIDKVGPPPPGWSDVPPETPSVADPGELRKTAYLIEADPLRDLALSYRAEGEALRLAGEKAAAGLADEKYRRELSRYLEKKREIRARHPKPEEEEAFAAKERGGNDAEAVFYLTRSGAYHREECGYTRAAGEWLALSAIRSDHPAARPCARCRPAAEEKA